MRQVQERRFIFKRDVPFDGLEPQGTVHRPAFEVDVAEFAGEPGSNGALPGASRTINGDDKFARGGIAHSKKKNCTRRYPNTNVHEAGTQILQFALPVADSLRVK